jgi:pilus assembly protein CpaC
VNLLEVAGVHQVMLEVRVSEISRSLLKRLGFNFGYVSGSGNNFGLSLLNQLTSLPQTGFPSAGVGVSDTVNGVIRFLAGGATWTVFIDALKEDGLLKVLAEPTLITLSGKTANFLAGGEFPIPVPQSSLGGGVTITIEYKPFGVGLNFTPTVLSNKKISMQVAPEVSDLDFSNAITTSGFVVPAITTRRVSTVIELADGQSFAIAGLLKDDVREIVSKFPVLGDIPILGALFRSSSFRKNETELLVIVTAHLVKPLDRGRQPLPTDQYIEPDDFEFFLFGDLEGKGAKARSKQEGGLEGEFGYLLPK